MCIEKIMRMSEVDEMEKGKISKLREKQRTKKDLKRVG